MTIRHDIDRIPDALRICSEYEVNPTKIENVLAAGPLQGRSLENITVGGEDTDMGTAANANGKRCNSNSNIITSNTTIKIRIWIRRNKTHRKHTCSSKNKIKIHIQKKDQARSRFYRDKTARLR